ncbi:hypothetical protein [Shewanella sp. Koi 1]
MKEKEFNELVIDYCKSLVEEYFTNNEDSHDIVVGSYHIYTGSMPWWNESRNWKWETYKRQIDVVIGINAQIENKKYIVPLVTIELKSGLILNTDELDKKSAIYGGLKEVYPWVHTIFLHSDISERNMGMEYIMRNARQFDSIYTEWNDKTKALLQKIISYQLDYTLDYWEL